MPDRFWSGFLVAAIIFTLLTGWLSEARLRVAEQRVWQQRMDATVADQVLLYDAFRLAVPDRRDRALAGAQAVHESMKREKEKR